MGITGLQFLGAVSGIIVFVVGLIVVLRYRLKVAQGSAKDGEEGRRKSIAGRVKYSEVDVLRNTGVFFKVGLFVAMATVLLAMSWTTYEYAVFIPEDAGYLDDEIEIEIPRTKERELPPPLPPPKKLEVLPEEELPVEEQPEFLDQSIEQDAVVEDIEPEVAPPTPPPVPKPVPEENSIFRVVEQMPRFPGCEDEATNDERAICAQRKLLQYIYKHVKYPAIARENGIEGRVVIQFVVEKNGRISDINVVRDIGAGCGDEARRVVESMNDMSERWVPGKQIGKPVRVQFTLPVSFKLKK